MAETQLETVAYIIKEELITSIGHHTQPNTFVIEAEEPYPGYYGANIPNSKKMTPGDIFLVLKKRYAAEQVAHISRKVKQKCGIDFDPARAELFFFNDMYSAIRLRGLSSYEQIETVQKWYMDNGVSLAKKEDIDTKAVIKIQKILLAEEVEPGVYVDLEDEYSKYFEIPREISWLEFVSMTVKIKRNTGGKDYDAALGGIFRKKGLVDMIRIYSDKEASIDSLKTIRDLYLAEIKKLD